MTSSTPSPKIIIKGENLPDLGKTEKSLRMETKTESLWDLLENPPNYAENITRMYSWSLNVTDFSLFRKFLDIIGYGTGELFAEWSQPSKHLGILELGYLGQALEEYSNRPGDAKDHIARLLEAETH